FSGLHNSGTQFLRRFQTRPAPQRIFRHTLEERAAFRPDHFTGSEPHAEIRSFPWKPAFPDENGDMEVKTSGCQGNRAHVSHVHQAPPPFRNRTPRCGGRRLSLAGIQSPSFNPALHAELVFLKGK
ncbi:hypothetical protein QTP86_018604, partial [Hemibagrus guttatus]